jgi:primary-amine oxidase
VTETPLLTTHAAMRMAAPEKARVWKIKNPAVINPISGQPVSFKLIPTTSECLVCGGSGCLLDCWMPALSLSLLVVRLM